MIYFTKLKLSRVLLVTSAVTFFSGENGIAVPVEPGAGVDEEEGRHFLPAQAQPKVEEHEVSAVAFARQGMNLQELPHPQILTLEFLRNLMVHGGFIHTRHGTFRPADHESIGRAAVILSSPSYNPRFWTCCRWFTYNNFTYLLVGENAKPESPSKVLAELHFVKE